MSGRKLVAFAALATAAAAGPLQAQSWRFDLGVNGGYSWYTKSIKPEDFGATDGPGVKFHPNWLTGAQLGFWFTPSIGLRANMTYTDTKLQSGDVDVFHDNNLWSGTGDLMFRFKKPAPTFPGFELLPYLALGLGDKWTNPAWDSYSVNDPTANEQWNGVPFACAPNTGICNGPPEGTNILTVPGVQSYFLSEEHVLMGLVGLGADWRVAPHFAIRTEVGDRIWKAPMIAVSPTAYPTLVTATNSDTKVGHTVNEPYVQVGLHLLMGLASAPVVAIAPAPAPPPPPAPAPAPAPAPETQTVSVCTVDVTAPNGLRTMTATFTPSTGDTTVTVNGQEVAISQAVGTVPVASNATWYIQGQPLVIGQTRQVKYVSFGSSRMIEPTDLTFVGTVNGMPVYADKDQAAQLMTDLNTTTPGELTTVVDTNRKVRMDLNNMKVLYTPLQPTGCVFQPVQLQEQVRKVRGD